MILTEVKTSNTVYFAYMLQNGTLTIEKSGDLLDDETALFRITDSSGNTDYEAIQGSGSKTITGLTVDDAYIVEEMTDWVWRYKVQEESPQSVLICREESRVSFMDTGNDNYLTDESFASNIFKQIEVSA